MSSETGVPERLAPAGRASGAVIAGAYLLGIVPGPLVAVIGGLGLMGVARMTSREARRRTASSIGLVIAAALLSIPSIRSGAASLEDLRGLQAVLGPGLLVGQPDVVAAQAIVAGGALVAFAAWLAPPVEARTPAVLELSFAGLTVATVFWGPALRGFAGVSFGVVLDIGTWAIAAGVSAVAIVVLARILARSPVGWSWTALLFASACAVAGLAQASL